MSDDPISIDAMIAEIGGPRNYAEQCLVDRMRQYALTEAAMESHYMKHVEWSKALTTMHAILLIRAHGTTPATGRRT